MANRQWRKQGAGFTVSLSRAVVILEAGERLPVGEMVRLFIDWPVQLEQRLDLTLELKGKIVQADSTRAIVAIFRYEFRIRARKHPAAADPVAPGLQSKRAGG